MKGNSIEKRIEIAIQSIERNKNRKNRREKAEKKLAMLINLRDVVIPRQEAEKKAEKERKKEERKIQLKIKNRERYWQQHIPVYRTNGRVEREAREDDLYTLEQLFNPPEEETGRINIDVWNRLVKECRIMLGNMK